MRLATSTVLLSGFLIGCIFSATSSSAQEFHGPVDSDGHIVQFARDIVPIFKSRCLECHGPDDQKGDFRIDDVDTVMSYVEPGDLESSLMYTDYLLSDEEDMVMPPPTHNGPLSAADLALIRVWILEGAVWPDGVKLSDEVAKPEPKPTSLIGRLWAFQGYFHPATVHFPVALLTFGAIFVVLGWKWPALGTQIPLACLIFGAISSIGATMMGWSFADRCGYPSWTNFDMDNEFFWHRWGGVIVTVTAAVMAVVALVSIKRKSESLTRVWKVGLLVLAAMVGMVGHQGGELTYGSDFYPEAFRTLLGEEKADADDKPAKDADKQAADEQAVGDAKPDGNEKAVGLIQPSLQPDRTEYLIARSSMLRR